MTNSRKPGLLGTLLGIERPTNWDTVKKVLAKRYNLKTINTETIAKYMAVEMGLADPIIISPTKPVGAPNKWNISQDGLTLYVRFEREIMQNPNLKKSSIATNVKQKYGYKISDKRIQNLYTILQKDPFVQVIFKAVHYNDMSPKDRIKFLTLYATKDS